MSARTLSTRPLSAGPMENGGATAEAGLKFPDLLIYRGYSAPVRMEVDVHDLEVIGTIPPELNGAYFRNSADPAYPPLLGKDIFLSGDGMLHKVRFENGHADLRTRYVRTEKFLAERAARRALFGAYRNPFTDLPEVAGMDRGTANTSVMWHHGRLYAIKEDSRPTQIDPETLETLGSWDFDGKLKSRTFTAHPKIDPVTGEMIAYAYNTGGQASREIEVYTISPAGEILRSERFEAPYCSMVHDFLVSRNYVAFVICPMVCDWERVRNGEPYWHWDSSRKTMVGIFARREGVKSIRWYTCPVVAMQTHSFNAWEDSAGGSADDPRGGQRGTVLHLDHFVTASGWLSQFPDLHDPHAKERPPFGERWSFDLSDPADRFDIRRLIDHVGEMPVIDTRFAMRRARHFWFGTANRALGPMLDMGPKGPPFTCLGHFDEAADRIRFWYAGPDSAPEEPCFVPRSGGGPGSAQGNALDAAVEGEGWLLTMVGRRAENRTDLVILDALNIDRGPIAVVRFPCRVHEGFHGIWVSEQALALGTPDDA